MTGLTILAAMALGSLLLALAYGLLTNDPSRDGD